MIIDRHYTQLEIEYALCPKCETELKKENTVYAVDPPLFTYVCPNCGYREHSTINYPHLNYIRRDSDE